MPSSGVKWFSYFTLVALCSSYFFMSDSSQLFLSCLPSCLLRFNRLPPVLLSSFANWVCCVIYSLATGWYVDAGKRKGGKVDEKRGCVEIGLFEVHEGVI